MVSTRAWAAVARASASAALASARQPMPRHRPPICSIPLTLSHSLRVRFGLWSNGRILVAAGATAFSWLAWYPKMWSERGLNLSHTALR